MRKLTCFAVGTVAVTAAALYWLPRNLVCLALVILLAGGVCAALFYRRLSQRAKCCAIAIWGAVVGLLSFWTYDARQVKPIQTYIGSVQTIEVEACSYCVQTDYGSRLVVKLLEQGKPIGKLAMYLKDIPAQLRPGDKLTLLAEIRDATAAQEDDGSFYYGAKGVYAQAYQRGAWRLDAAQTLPVRYWPVALSQRVKAVIGRIFPSDTVGFMTALLTGDRSGLSYTDKMNLSIAGVYHTVAISGMHVSILVSILMLLCVRRRRLVAVVGIPTILFFIAFVGSVPSVIRAGVMAIVLLLAPLLGREGDTPTSLSLAILLLLGNNPYALLDWGLQLSFASVIGITLFSKKLFYLMSNWRMTQIFAEKSELCRKLAVFILNAASIYVGVNALTLPLVIVYFGMVPVLGLLGNLLILWAITVLFAGGILACAAAIVVPSLGGVLGWALGWLVRYIQLVCSRISRIPNAAVFTDGAYMVFFLLFYLAVFYLTLYYWGGRTLLLSGCSVICVFCLCLLLSAQEYQACDLAFSALNVGQGQCLYFESAGYAVMVDCGGQPRQSSGEVAARFLQGIGRNYLDGLVLTHYDLDHIGGLEQLLSRVSVGTLYLPDIDDDVGNRDWVVAVAEKTDTEIVYVTSDLCMQWNGGQVQIFAPVSDTSDNAASLSVLWTVDDFDILATGDMDIEAENLLMQTHDLPDIEVLVAGHHGSGYSTGYRLLKKLAPETVIISVGTNSYGHPTDEVLARIASTGAEVYRTDQAGTITIRR